MTESENIRKMLDILREAQENLNETDGVPYTNGNDTMLSILEVAKKQFGADFSEIKYPLLYYPKDGNITLSGKIGSLNDAKFQFSYKDDTNGCSLWLDPLYLNEETLKKINVIFGVYKNWKNELDSTEDIKPIDLRNTDMGQDDTGGRKMVPGDDF